MSIGAEVVVEFPEVASRPFGAAGEDERQELELVEKATTLEDRGDLVEWTPERAAALIRGFGLALHTLDPATELDGGEDLWRATSQEASEIGAPLSRILARYEPARRLAGVVDEAELGAAFVSYTKRNLKQRGRVVMAARDERRAFGGDTD